MRFIFLRPDRDENVKVNWENIQPGKERHFGKRTEKGTTEYMSYDFHSIMHYGSMYFSRNGQKTIGELNGMPAITEIDLTYNSVFFCLFEVNNSFYLNSHAEIFAEPKNGYVGDIGRQEKMTGTDKMALNTLYDCETVSSKVILQFMKEENARIKREFKQLKNQPFAVLCAWQDYWNTAHTVITYDRITYEAVVGGPGGMMDINTGVFTVGRGFSGVWSVTYSIQSWQYSGEVNHAWLFINGEQISESEHYTYNGDMAGDDSLGSRTLYMRLESGDQVSLRTGEVQYLSQTTFCFQLLRGDK